MKKLFIAAVFAAVALCGCATTGAPQSPAQIQANLATQVKKACAVVVPTIASMQSMQTQLTADQQDNLAKASGLADKVCTMGLTPAPQTVADFVQAAFPIMIKIVDASPLLPQDKATASVALTAAQIAVSVALAQ